MMLNYCNKIAVYHIIITGGYHIMVGIQPFPLCILLYCVSLYFFIYDTAERV